MDQEHLRTDPEPGDVAAELVREVGLAAAGEADHDEQHERAEGVGGTGGAAGGRGRGEGEGRGALLWTRR